MFITGLRQGRRPGGAPRPCAPAPVHRRPVELLESRTLLSAVDVAPTAAALTLQSAPVAVASVTGTVPAHVVSGDAKAIGRVVVTLRNDASTAFDGRVAVTLLASDNAVAHVVARSNKPLELRLEPGQAKRVKFNVPLASLRPGSYTLLGAATANGLTSSANGPSLAVAAPAVRLVGAGAPATPAKPLAAGRTASLAVLLRNEGNVATTRAPATYTILFSTDGAATSPVYQTTATAKLNLKPGASRPQNVRFAVPAGSALPAGAYTVTVKVSAELNDTNGTVLVSIPVTVA